MYHMISDLLLRLWSVACGLWHVAQKTKNLKSVGKFHLFLRKTKKNDESFASTFSIVLLLDGQGDLSSVHRETDDLLSTSHGCLGGGISFAVVLSCEAESVW